MRRTVTPKFVMLRISSSVATNVFVRAVVIYTFGLLLFFAMCGMVRAQTTLSIGDVQTLGATSDANDSFSFVLWKDIEAGTVLRFMDHSFTNATTGVNGTENDMSLTFSSALTAGSVVRVENTGTTLVNGGTFSGTKTGSLSGISNDGDQVFIYQGTAMGSGTSFTGRTLLHGFNLANTNWLTSGTASAQASYIPTVITVADASFDSGNFDNVDYTGTRTGLTTAAFRAAVSSITNYTQNDTRFDLATGGFTIASSTSLHWDANGSTAGNGGAGTWDTTTADRFKNGASGTTFLRWVNSSAGNDHTAVFGGTAGTVSLASGGVTVSGLQFDTSGYTIQNNTITLSGSSTPQVSVGSGVTATVSSVLSGTAGLIKTGNGTLIAAGANDYSGSTNIQEGTLQLSTGNDRLPTGTVVNLGKALAATLGTLDLNGRSQTVAGLASVAGTNATTSNNVVTSSTAATLTLNIPGGTYTFGDGTNANSGVITGAISLVKDGAGTQILDDANIYTGTSTILGGVLQIGSTGNGKSGTGNLTVNGSTAVLAGNGTVESAVTFVTLGNIKPGSASGDAIGAMTIKHLTFTPVTPTTVAELQIGSASSFDFLNVQGDLSLNSNSNIRVTALGYTPLAGDTFSLIDWSGSLSTGGFSTGTNLRTGNNADGNEGNLDLPDISASGYSWQISSFSGSGSLTLTVVVPEPGRTGIAAFGLALIALRRRRTNK